MKLTQSKLLNNIASIALVLSLLTGAISTETAWATPESGDQTSLSEEELRSACDAGLLPSQQAQSQDTPMKRNNGVDGDITSSLRTISTTSAVTTFTRSDTDISDRVNVYKGADRYGTSAATARAGWTSSRYAIVVSGESWPDALSASSLAGALDCPILLTSISELSSDTQSVIKELGIASVIVVGGDAAVSENAYNQIEAIIGNGNVTRLAGGTRYETQMKVYSYGQEKSLWSEGAAVIANGSGEAFADALSISPVAFKKHMPVLLTDETGQLPEATRLTLIADSKTGEAFSRYYIIGGTSRVSERCEGYLTGLATLTAQNGIRSDIEVKRIAGDTRYETSAQIASWAVSTGVLSIDGAGFSSATIPYDALGGGAFCGHKGTVLLLVDDDNYASAVNATSNLGGVSYINFFGGENAVSYNTKLSIGCALGIAKRPLKVYLDAGHGWNSSNDNSWDPGASGNGYEEAVLTQELVRLIGAQLKNTYGVDVVVNDYGGWYKMRQADAENQGCDVLVSIHFNASTSPDASGCESYIHSYNSASGSDRLQSLVHPALIYGMGLYDRGMKSAELAVVGGKVPAVLLEIGFITNYDDMTAYQSRKALVASEIARGIANYA